MAGGQGLRQGGSATEGERKAELAPALPETREQLLVELAALQTNYGRKALQAGSD